VEDLVDLGWPTFSLKVLAQPAAAEKVIRLGVLGSTSKGKGV
jgi:hypothetical protein